MPVPLDRLRDPAAEPREAWLASLPIGQYAALKQRVRAAGLLARQPGYYTGKLVLTLALLALSVLLLVSVSCIWLQLFNALLLAAVFVQIAFLGHDIGHREVAHPGRLCTVLELLCGNALLGVDATWWVAKHNRHHAHPNRDGVDPDIALPIVAFSAAQARRMTSLQRVCVRYQHVVLPLLLPLEAVALRFDGIRYLLVERGRRWLLELGVIAFHLGVYGWLVFHSLGLSPGIAFMAVHQLAFGFYMSVVFAPNHKGMWMFAPEDEVDFLLEQVLSSRNLRGSPLTDFLYGGLNYQIEHHLFPSMPRNRLRQAQPIVTQFCAERGVPYCETSVRQSYGVILRHLHAVGRGTAMP